MEKKDINNKGFSMGKDYPHTERRVYQQGFIEGALWAQDSLIEEATKWLARNADNYARSSVTDCKGLLWVDAHMIEDFRKAIDDKK